MAGKKTTDKKESGWVGEIEKYSRQIWLAGLGAYSKVSKDGSKLFETLVKDGEKAEKLAKTEVDKSVGVVKSTARSARTKVDEVKDKALGKWSELEEAFDKRLNSAISRLGVPSRNEVKELHSKVESLTKQIEKLTGVSVKAAKPAAAAKPTAKAAAKPVPKAAAKPVAKPATAKSAAAAKATVAKPVAKAAAKPAAAKPAVKAAAKPAAAKPVAAKKPAVKKAAAPKAAAPKPAAAAVAPAPAPTPAPAAAAPAAPSTQA